MANMEERLETVVTQAETDGSKWHTIVHGDENSTVETENGDVPTVAKQLKDIREAITGGVSDVVAEAESARDEAKSVRDNALTIKNEIELLKTDTEEATETAKSYKNMAQTTFNSISSAVNKGIADVQTETQNQIATLQTTGDTQVNRTQTAAIEQIQLASNQADRAETAAVRAENATNNKLDIDCANINLSQVLSALGMTANNSNNYFKFPLLLANGTIRHFIFQYGITSCRIDGDTALTFPTEFPNACLTGQASFNFAFSTNSDAGCGIYNLSKTGATLRNGNNNVGNISWWVLGY